MTRRATGEAARREARRLIEYTTSPRLLRRTFAIKLLLYDGRNPGEVRGVLGHRKATMLVAYVSYSSPRRNVSLTKY